MISTRHPIINSRFVCALALAITLFACAWASKAAANTCGDRPIQIAEQNWESASFIAEVIAQIAEHAYGCQVSFLPGTTAATEAALAQNDVQIIAEQWTGRSKIIEDALAEGSVQVVGDTLEGGAEQGWYVPDYVVHGDTERGIEPVAPDLQTWRDLERYTALFSDPEEPSKGRFHNCPSGWVCEQTNTRLLEVHGLDRFYTNFRAGTGAALDSAISSAYEQGQAILFYYWQPAGLMAKYSFHKIQQDPFDAQCWETIVSGEGDLCSSDFLLARLGIAVSTPFADEHPELMEVFKRLQFTPDVVNGAILRMSEARLSAQDLATQFLVQHAEVWRPWLTDEAAHRLALHLETQAQTTEATVSAAQIFPDWSIAQGVNHQLQRAVQSWGVYLRAASDVLLTRVLLPVERLLLYAPAWSLLAIVALLSWHATRRWWLVLAYTGGLYLIGAFGLWDKLIQTFALVLVATFLSVLIGLPLGILGARWRWLRRIMTPLMDVMQTLPSFVYLIPVLMLFGLGKVPALLATIVYAVPPLVRLTTLGLRSVDHTITEAAQSFGVTRGQMLRRVTLPLARPTIMAGINQTTMMALAMVVVASMIGARGLGEDVLAGIQTLDVGRGLQAGIAIVILAIVIDRITQAYGEVRRKRHPRRIAQETVQKSQPSSSGPRATSNDPMPVSQTRWAPDSLEVELDWTAFDSQLAARAQPSQIDISVQGVYKAFGSEATQAIRLLQEGYTKAQVQARTEANVGLAGVDLTIPAGKVTCVMGLSGSGKSTLIRHLNRLIDPTAGSIVLGGQNILSLDGSQLRELRRHTVSMVFQHFGLMPHMTLFDNVAFGLRVRGESESQIQASVAHWLAAVGLADYAQHYPDELSGGMRQRIGLARALATDAQVLLMDEAFSALDPLIRYDMQTQLLALQARLQKTIVFITHDMDEALRLGDLIVLLRDGRIEQVGSAQDIINAPANDYVRRFVQHRSASSIA